MTEPSAKPIFLSWAICAWEWLVEQSLCPVLSPVGRVRELWAVFLPLCHPLNLEPYLVFSAACCSPLGKVLKLTASGAYLRPIESEPQGETLPSVVCTPRPVTPISWVGLRLSQLCTLLSSYWTPGFHSVHSSSKDLRLAVGNVTPVLQWKK